MSLKRWQGTTTRFQDVKLPAVVTDTLSLHTNPPLHHRHLAPERILGGSYQERFKAVLTGAGCRWWVQGRAVVAEVTTAGLGRWGGRMAVGWASGTQLVPGG